MRYIAAIAIGLFLFVPLTAVESSTQALTPESLTGAWIATDDEGNPQRALYIFTEANYSIMFVPGEEPRAETSETATDAEKIAAYDSFVANSGRYTLEGDQLTYEAYMAKAPNYMATWGDNAQTATVRMEGDILVWTAPNGNTTRLSRPGGQ